MSKIIKNLLHYYILLHFQLQMIFLFNVIAPFLTIDSLPLHLGLETPLHDHIEKRQTLCTWCFDFITQILLAKFEDNFDVSGPRERDLCWGRLWTPDQDGHCPSWLRPRWTISPIIPDYWNVDGLIKTVHFGQMIRLTWTVRPRWTPR